MTQFKSVILVCEIDSWIMPYVKKLRAQLEMKGIECDIALNYEYISYADAVFFLGCTSVCPEKILSRNKHNFVVHESKLPSGRGFAPISWEILNGADHLTFSLIEACARVDQGRIVKQFSVTLLGHELCQDLRKIQGENTVKICNDFILHGDLSEAYPQRGRASYFRRRTPADSELNIHKTIAEQFNLLRIVDNERYPAFFKYRGRKYMLNIEDIGPTDD